MSRSPGPTGRSLDLSPRNLGVNIAPAKTSSNTDNSRPPTAISQAGGLGGIGNTLPAVAAFTRGSDRGPEQPLSNSPVAWRSTGIHSILNPASEASQGSVRTTRNSPELRGSVGSQTLPLPAYASPRGRKRGDAERSTHQHDSYTTTPGGRRMLTPRSPGLRVASLGGHRSPSLGPGFAPRGPPGSGDSRAYTADPGEKRDSAIPPVPTLPAPHALPAMQVSTSDNLRPITSGVSAAFSSGPASSVQASSSDTTHLSYGRPSTASPPYPQAQGSASQASNQAPGQELPPGFNSRAGPQYGTGGWRLALDGGEIGVFVDNQQASKMADEKRKRNAGASARFRARRKEKEKEASQTIAGLQQDLRDMAEDRDFYMNERNYFRDLLAGSVQGSLPPRPPSPQIRRVHRVPTTTGHDSDISSDYGRQESLEAVPPPRRRTGEFQSSFPAASPNVPAYNPPYPPPPGPGYTFANAPPPPPPGLSTTYQDPRGGPLQGAQLPPPRPQGLDPFRRDVLDRNWNSGKQ